MSEDSAASLDSKQGVHRGVALLQLSIHDLETSNARLFAADNLVFGGDTKHAINT